MCTVLLLRINALPISNSLDIERNNTAFPLEISYPDALTYHLHNSTKWLSVRHVKAFVPSTMSYSSTIPSCIATVPYGKRKYLSPVYLHSSLGRTVNTNASTNNSNQNIYLVHNKIRKTQIFHLPFRILLIIRNNNDNNEQKRK
jgi:hypothetical protein